MPAAGTQPKRGERPIGAILIDAGRLTLEDAERILRLQREQGLRFGEAATQLGVLTGADIAFALSRQFDYPYLLRGESAVSEDLVAAYDPFSPQVEALRTLRSQLMLRWFDTELERKALAIVSAGRGEGRSFIAANLAVVFSQLGEHTLLIDADMRNPCQHKLFGLENRVGLSGLLAERCGTEAIQRIPALLDLSVLPAGAGPPNPSELLARPLFSQLLQELGKEFDVILLDTPAAAETGDAQTVIMRAGAALIVVRKNATRMSQVRDIADTTTQASATVVGTVLNEF
ncbi:MAG: chain length determinant protein tyrosine kinase EpsG [Betaproteobacteria bacterium RIFCSPLOWO2_12_FULL_62_13]|nr:MAG: chain length determinant protein tyrosine kinase EpsG [Betaproteobacteria bacterium RIFCSPLOWO2_12_FULL_62_13]